MRHITSYFLHLSISLLANVIFRQVKPLLKSCHSTSKTEKQHALNPSPSPSRWQGAILPARFRADGRRPCGQAPGNHHVRLARVRDLAFPGSGHRGWVWVPRLDDTGDHGTARSTTGLSGSRHHGRQYCGYTKTRVTAGANADLSTRDPSSVVPAGPLRRAVHPMRRVPGSLPGKHPARG